MNSLIPPTQPSELFAISRWIVPILVTMGLLLCFGSALVPIVCYLVFGWIPFLIKHSQQEQPDASILWLSLATLTLFACISFITIRTYRGNSQSTMRASTTTCLILISLATSTLGMIGFVRQATWMSMIDAPLIVGGNQEVWANLSQANLALWTKMGREWREAFVSPPKSHLSWESYLIAGSAPYGYIGDGEFSPMKTMISLDLPWDAVKNREFFSTQQKFFVNPGLHLLYPHGEYKYDVHGYALNNYSANQLMMPDGKTFRPIKVTDGESNTLYLGEIREYFPPWGKPGNVRDVTLGINKNPKGFGGPFPGGCYFSMVDGSTRFLNEAIDPKVLAALATPSGEEHIPKEF